MKARLGLMLVCLTITASLYASQSDTASISGAVFMNAAEGAPVRRAVVSLFGGNSSLGRHAITDDAGKFAFTGLPAGRYTLSAAKKSFVTIPFGAVRAGQSGAPLIITAGQRVENVRLLVARGAVITGTVRDADGEPLSTLDVRLEAKSGIGTARALTLAVKTDDQGVYRFFGIPAGAYYVSTRPANTGRGDVAAPSDGEVDAALRELKARQSVSSNQPSASNPALRNVASSTPARPVDVVPVFYPGVFDAGEAALVTVAAGEERAGIDIGVRMISTSAVSGTIANTGRRSPAEIEITLNRGGQTGPPSGSMRTIARPDGSFRLAGVTPGKYLLVARALSSALFDASFGKAPPGVAEAPGACMFAAEEIQVTGADASGVSLTLRPCLRLEGRIEGSTAAQGAGVALQPVAGTGVPMYSPIRVPATVSKDGRFTLGEFADVLPGIYHVSVTLPPSAIAQGWQVDRATMDGQDVLDTPLRVASDRVAPISLVVTLTDRHTSLAGSLEPAASRLPSEYTVIAFAANRDWWSQPYRRVKATRVSFDGQYQIEDLPPGEYLLAALSDLAPDEWRDADFLALIAPGAMRIAIAPGEKRTQNLRIGR